LPCHGIERVDGKSRSFVHGVAEAEELVIYIVISASRKAIRAPQNTQSPRLKTEFAAGRPGSLIYRN